METRSAIIPEGIEGMRVDAGLAKLFGFSRTQAAEIAEAGGVLRSGVTLGKSDHFVAGDVVEVSWSPRREATLESTPVENLTVIFDDDDIIVIDKPVGVAAHPTVGWDGPTVLGALTAAGYRVSTSGAAERAGIVHRLDVGTSGLMVVAKSEQAYTELKRAFHDRNVSKVYRSVVQGHPDPLAGTIDAPIGRHPRSNWKFAVTSEGKPSVTHYETLEAFPAASLLEIKLETGRTHQIRVHMAAQRHPCVGDSLYGADPTLSARLGLSRQWLHAHRLGFTHPTTGIAVEFESPYPEDLKHALDVLRS